MNSLLHFIPCYYNHLWLKYMYHKNFSYHMSWLVIFTIWIYYHDMTSHTLLTCKSHADHNEEAGAQVIIMNCIWIICVIAVYYLVIKCLKDHLWLAQQKSSMLAYFTYLHVNVCKIKIVAPIFSCFTLKCSWITYQLIWKFL